MGLPAGQQRVLDTIKNELRISDQQLAATFVSHSIPEYFPRPSAFDPARFMPGRRQDENLHCFLAFGGGNHRCPGMRFGFLQVKAILSIILRRYDMSIGKARPEPDYRGLVVVPKRPCHVRYQRKLGAAGPA